MGVAVCRDCPERRSLSLLAGPAERATVIPILMPFDLV